VSLSVGTATRSLAERGRGRRLRRYPRQPATPTRSNQPNRLPQIPCNLTPILSAPDYAPGGYRKHPSFRLRQAVLTVMTVMTAAKSSILEPKALEGSHSSWCNRASITSRLDGGEWSARDASLSHAGLERWITLARCRSRPALAQRAGLQEAEGAVDGRAPESTVRGRARRDGHSKWFASESRTARRRTDGTLAYSTHGRWAGRPDVQRAKDRPVDGSADIHRRCLILEAGAPTPPAPAG
jgi:hypothetical protein